MPDIQVAILSVSTRNTSTGKTVYDVACGDGEKRQIWEAPLAQAINAFSGTGQPVTLREEVKQNGQYTNRTIKAFSPPGSALPPEVGGGGAIAPQPLRAGSSGGGGMTPADKTRISKMGAQGSAAQIVGSLFTGAGPESFEQAIELHEQLTKKLYKDARSHEAESGTQVIQTNAQGAMVPAAGVLPVVGQPVDAAVIAAAVPGVTVGVPVAAAQDAAAPSGDNIDWN